MVKLEVIIPPIKTERRQITDGKTGGDKHTIKKTETTGTPPVLPSVVPVVSIFCMIFLSPPVLPALISLDWR
jgi:hypothetical protein